MKNKGITLVALVITIIILLILAGITISSLTGTELFRKTQEAKEKYKNSQELENNYLEEYENEIEKYSKKEKGIKITEIFDPTGEKEGKLHIGDFVNYTAGSWTQTDLDKIANSGAKIAANNDSTSFPTTQFQFGGFQVGNSKDGNAKMDGPYDYVKEKSTGEAVTGWRIFDIEEDGTITLISAGCPEDYLLNGWGGYGYLSDYILTGNENNGGDSATLGYGSEYIGRDWSMYINQKYKVKSATVFTKENLDKWYKKRINNPNVDSSTLSTFRVIYNTNYESLIDNYSFYWLTCANVWSSQWCVSPSGCFLDGNTGTQLTLGIRILVSLSPETRITEKSIGTKTIISREKEYTYNIWDLQ